MSDSGYGRLINALLVGIVLLLLVQLYLPAQTADREIRALAEIFYEDVTPPRDAAPFVAFAKEIAIVQRERDAQLAEKMGAPNIARAIRGAR